MTDEENDVALRRTLEQYNAPPPLPTESLWSAIEEAESAGSAAGARPRRALHVTVPWAAAAALALFAAGIGAGAALTRGPAIAIDSLPAVIDEHHETDQEMKLVIWF